MDVSSPKRQSCANLEGRCRWICWQLWFFSHVYVNPGLCAEHFLLSQLVSFLTWRFCSPCETDQSLKTWLWHFAHRLIPYWLEFVQTCFRCMFSPWLSVQFFFPGSPSLLTGAAALGAWMVLPGLQAGEDKCKVSHFLCGMTALRTWESDRNSSWLGSRNLPKVTCKTRATRWCSGPALH